MARAERETAARISEEIGNLMKEIETLVEEKAKESADMSKFIREGAEGRGVRWDGDLRVPAASSWPLHVGGGRTTASRVRGTHPCVLLTLFVPQVAPWCTKGPASP